MQSQTPIVRFGPSLKSFFITPRATLHPTFPRLTMTRTSNPCELIVPQLVLAFACEGPSAAVQTSIAAVNVIRAKPILRLLNRWPIPLEITEPPPVLIAHSQHSYPPLGSGPRRPRVRRPQSGG